MTMLTLSRRRQAREAAADGSLARRRHAADAAKASNEGLPPPTSLAMSAAAASHASMPYDNYRGSLARLILSPPVAATQLYNGGHYYFLSAAAFAHITDTRRPSFALCDFRWQCLPYYSRCNKASANNFISGQHPTNTD